VSHAKSNKNHQSEIFPAKFLARNITLSQPSAIVIHDLLKDIVIDRRKYFKLTKSLASVRLNFSRENSIFNVTLHGKTKGILSSRVLFALV